MWSWFSSVEGRLASFKKWPHPRTYGATPETLSQAGFYSNPVDGSLDNACCFMCEKNLDGWESTDEAWAEHVQHSPMCPLVSLECLQSRLKTFVSWSHSRPSSQSLAEAGFYYYPRTASATDKDDTAVCFQCGLGLDGWEPTDDPVHEHSRRRPDCPFVRGKIAVRPFSFHRFLASLPEVSKVRHVSASEGSKFFLPKSSKKPGRDTFVQTPSKRPSLGRKGRTSAAHGESLGSLPRQKYPATELRHCLQTIKSKFPFVDENQPVAEILDLIVASKMRAFDELVSIKLADIK